MSKKVNEDINLDITDKSLLDFKKSKSISVASKLSDLKSSKIGELYDVKTIHDNMQRICQKKINKKMAGKMSLPKHISHDVCDCLFEKNKSLSIVELDKRVREKLDTPASTCITIIDKYLQKHPSKRLSTRSTRSTSNKKSKKTSRSSKSRRTTKRRIPSRRS